MNFKSLKEGDIIRDKNSGNHWTFLSISRYYKYQLIVKPADESLGLRVVTNKSHRTFNDPVNTNWELVTEDQIKQAEIEKMDKIYEFTHEGKTFYGIKMAVNSAGLWVMDVKGGQPVAVPKDSCKEVIPYSVKMRYLDAGNVEHVMVDKDKVQEGGMYVTNSGRIVTVIKVNTETKTPNEVSIVSKILTEPV